MRMQFINLSSDTPGLSEYVTVAGSTQTITSSKIFGAGLLNVGGSGVGTAVYTYSGTTTSTFISIPNGGAGCTSILAGNLGTSTTATHACFASATAGVTSFRAIASTDLATAAAGSTTQIQFNDASAMAGDADLTWDKTNNVLNLAQSTATTKGTLTVNQPQTRPAVLLTGTGTDGVGDATAGIAMFLTHNGAGNRQFCIGNSDNFNSATASVFRYLTGSSIASIDGITGNASTRCPINLGTDTTSVAIGDTALAYNVTLPGKLSIYAEASGVGLNINLGSSGTGDLARFSNNSGTALSVVSSAGKIGAVQTSPTAYVHLGAGTASANTAPLKFTSGTHLTTPETGAMEFNGTHFYGSVGTTRYQLDQQNRMLLTFQLAASTALTTTAVYLKNGEIQLTATKGIVILAACTIEGMSQNADITTTGGKAPAVKLMVMKNGTEVASVGSTTTGADAKAYNNTAGSASFAANDVLSVAMVMTGSAGPTATVVNMLGTVELRYTL